MNKQELIAQIAEGADVSKAAAGRMLNSFIRNVQHAVVSGDKVNISNFGIFESRERAPRVGRNINTGEALSIPSKEVPVFLPANSFKQKTNER